MPKIPKSTPDILFRFLESVRLLQPCTIETVRSHMQMPWPPVRSARTFAEYFNLVTIQVKQIRLTTLAERLFRYDGNKRVDFVINHVRLQDREPFLSLRKELPSQRNGVALPRLGDMLRLKSEPYQQWSSQEKLEYGKFYAEWLKYLRIADVKDDKVFYIAGAVRGFDVTSLAEIENILERTLYDWLVESFNTPKNMIDEPYKILKRIDSAKLDEERGELFEQFAVSIFKRFGFSPRHRAGPREQKSHLTFKKTKGSGDVAVLCHYPISAQDKVYTGFAIACEAKSTEAQVGSKAVGQARNLAKKIHELYTDYLVQPIILSRSAIGYDQSGKDLAPPEVLHLNHKSLLSLLALQKERLDKGLKLITPALIMIAFDDFVKEQVIEPTTVELQKKIESNLI